MNKIINTLFAIIYFVLILLSLLNSGIEYYIDPTKNTNTDFLLLPFILSIPLMIHLNLRSKSITRSHNNFLLMTFICFITYPMIAIYAKYNPDYGNYGLGNAFLFMLLGLFWLLTIIIGTVAIHYSKKENIN